MSILITLVIIRLIVNSLDRNKKMSAIQYIYEKKSSPSKIENSTGDKNWK